MDFPYKKKNRLPVEQQKHNDDLAAKYNAKGQFPLMVLIDSEGEVLSEFYFNQDMTPKTLAAAIEKTTNIPALIPGTN